MTETNEYFQKRIEMSRYYRKKSQKALRNILIGGGAISLFVAYGYSSIKENYETGLLLGISGGLLSLVIGCGASMHHFKKGVESLLDKE